MANGDTTTEVVLIDFQTNLTELQTATEVLERTGAIDKKLATAFKQTNVEINNQQKAINNTAKTFDKAIKQEVVSIEQVRAEMEAFVADFVAGFQEGVIETLREAGIEFDEFGKVVVNNNQKLEKAAQTPKQELRELTQRITEAKIAGRDSGPEFDAMVDRAGKLRDAMGDATDVINKFASDTSKLDGVIGIAQGVASGFAVAQGAVALFGDESEALQETLLKVNAAMAVLQGLQQIGNLLQKESAANVLLSTVAQRGYNFAVGESIGLLKAFRIALALTGIGAVILGITLLVQWLSKSSDAIQQNIKDLQKLNDEFERDAANLDNFVGVIQRASEERIAALQAQGATEKQLRDERLNSLKEEQIGVFELEQQYRAQANAARQLLQDAATRVREFNEEEIEAAEAVVKKFEQTVQRRKELSTELRVQSIQNLELTRKEELQSIADGLEARLAGARQNSAQELALSKQLARARAAIELNEAGQNLQQRLLIEANLQKQIRQLDLNFAKVRQQDRVSGLQAALVAEQSAREAISIRTSQAEIDLQKRVIQETARLQLLEEGLTANQKLEIQKNALAQQAALQRSFNQQTNKEVLEDFISRNNTELANIQLTGAERLRLTEENIIAQAEIEIEANQGLSDRIKEIEAKRDADIKALRLQNMQETLSRELEIEAARTGALRRGQERILSLERSTLQQRIAALNQLAALDIANVNARQDANEQAFQAGLISFEDYLVQYEKLKDEELAITERTENAKAAAILETNKETIQIALHVAGQVLDIVEQIGAQRLEAEQQQIEASRAQVDELLEAGAITEREAERRQKKLDLEEKKLRRQQAQREKDFATFKALLAVPQAFLQGLVQGGPILGAIYAGLAAAQAILIASRQPPKFGGGKNNDYEGPAELGETGPELWQTDSGMYYVKKRAFVYVGKKDRVFNPAQTRAMLEKPGLQLDKSVSVNNNTAVQKMEIDYDKIGQAVGKYIPQTGFNFDESGFTMYQKGRTSFDKYIGKRRSY